ncbi:MAG: hypothetical protein AAFU69_05955, partial [Pseudomonadota bacterium]
MAAKTGARQAIIISAKMRTNASIYTRFTKDRGANAARHCQKPSLTGKCGVRVSATPSDKDTALDHNPYMNRQWLSV